MPNRSRSKDSLFSRIGQALVSTLRVISDEICQLAKLDAFVSIVLIAYCLIFLNSIFQNMHDPILLSALRDDDGLIAQQLDGMTHWPFGDPSFFLRQPQLLPEYWHHMNYQGLPYYGGAYLDVAFPLIAILKLIGFSFFPAGPILLRFVASTFTLLFLLASYNLVKSNFGKIPARISLLLLFGSYHLAFIGTVIPPDSMLFYFSVIFLSLALNFRAGVALKPIRASNWTLRIMFCVSFAPIL